MKDSNLKSLEVKCSNELTNIYEWMNGNKLTNYQHNKISSTSNSLQIKTYKRKHQYCLQSSTITSFAQLKIFRYLFRQGFEF